MTLAILIILGVIVYFIIGRTVIILFDDNDLTDTDEWRGVAIVIFPLVCLWVLFMTASEYLSDVITELMTGKKRNKW
jgi:amino acid transporter